MKSISIIAGLARLVAVSSAAAIPPPVAGVDLCTEQNYKSCIHNVVVDDRCNDLGPDLKNKISSVKPDPDVICGFFNDDCLDWNRETLMLLTRVPIANMSAPRIDKPGTMLNLEGQVKSYACAPLNYRRGNPHNTSSVASVDQGLTVHGLGAISYTELPPSGYTLNTLGGIVTSAVATAVEH